jgi:hypothetical protein
MPAQGKIMRAPASTNAALGYGITRRPSPERARQAWLIPHVMLVVFDLVTVEQSAQFVLKRHRAMMPCLILNVCLHLRRIRAASRFSSIWNYSF